MTNSALKTPLAYSLPAIGRATAKDAVNNLPQGLPCSVTEVVSSGIVTVKLEVSASLWTLPLITVPVNWSEYTRLPIQVGTKGVLVAAGTRLGHLSGLGGGPPLLTDQPGNLSTFSFEPLGSTEWANPIDPNAVELYGVNSSGVILHDGNSTNTVTVDANGVNLDCTDLGVFGTTPVTQQSITGALSAVTDSNAKAVLRSIINALVAYGLVQDSTT